MALQCNIDARGKVIRLIAGLIFLVGGFILLFAWAWPAGSVLAWTVALVAVAGGAFAIFEARAGWCIVRAMGLKTPM
jgi:hypothetical protein